MIVMIRGTHGSGKSTVVRKFMKSFTRVVPVYRNGRKHPFGYKCYLNPWEKPIWILGHYETATGGCDTIPKVVDMYNSIVKHAFRSEHVLFEGILAQHSLTRFIDLRHQRAPFKHMLKLQVLDLNTSLDMCIKSVIKRRKARGNATPLNSDNLTREFRNLLSSAKRLDREGIPRREVTRKQAGKLLKKLLLSPRSSRSR